MARASTITAEAGRAATSAGPTCRRPRPPRSPEQAPARREVRHRAHPAEVVGPADRRQPPYLVLHPSVGGHGQGALAHLDPGRCAGCRRVSGWSCPCTAARPSAVGAGISSLQLRRSCPPRRSWKVQPRPSVSSQRRRSRVSWSGSESGPRGAAPPDGAPRPSARRTPAAHATPEAAASGTESTEGTPSSVDPDGRSRLVHPGLVTLRPRPRRLGARHRGHRPLAPGHQGEDPLARAELIRRRAPGSTRAASGASSWSGVKPGGSACASTPRAPSTATSRTTRW